MLKFFLNSMEYQESVQQFHFASRFAFRHFNLQIGAQMRTVIPILNTSKLKIEMQIEMKQSIFLSVQQLPQNETLKRQLR